MIKVVGSDCIPIRTARVDSQDFRLLSLGIQLGARHAEKGMGGGEEISFFN